MDGLRYILEVELTGVGCFKSYWGGVEGEEEVKKDSHISGWYIH